MISFSYVDNVFQQHKLCYRSLSLVILYCITKNVARGWNGCVDGSVLLTHLLTYHSFLIVHSI